MIAKLRQNEFFDNKKDEAVMIIPVSQDTARKIERFGDTIDVVGQAGIFSI